MTDLMISYSRRDGDFVHQLHEALEKVGYQIWVDWQDIPLSADWWAEIATAIEAADTFLFVISPESMGSPICNLEIDHARKNNKRLVPIMYEETELESALKKLTQRELSDNTHKVLAGRDIESVARDNWNAIARHNWLSFNDNSTPFDHNIQRLREVLDTDLNHLREHTRLLVRAHEWDRRGRDSGYLLTGNAISEADTWLAHAVDMQPPPTLLHGDYIRASRQAAAQRQRRLLSLVSVGLAVSLVLAVVASLLALRNNQLRGIAETNAATAVYAQGEAERQADLAATSEARAVFQANLAAISEAAALRSADEANSLLWASSAVQLSDVGDSPLALALALEAARIQDPPALVTSALVRVAFAPGPQQRYDFGTAEINALDYSADGQRAVVALNDNRLVMLDLASGQIADTYTNEGAGVLAISSVDYSPRGGAVLAASFSQMMLIDTNTLDVIREMSHGSGTLIQAIAISPDGTQALSGALDNTIILWDLETGAAVRTLNGHTNAINAVAFTADGRGAISGSSDDRLILWDLATGEIVRDYPHTSDVLAVAVAPRGDQVATGTQLGDVTIWSLNTAEPLQTFDTAGDRRHTVPVTSLSFAPNGRDLISGSEDQRVIVWQSDGRVRQVFDAHDGTVTAVAYSPNGQTALSGSVDGSVFAWSTGPNVIAQNFNHLEGYTAELLAAGYDLEGDQVIAVDLDGNLLQWALDNRRLMGRFTLPDGEALPTTNVLIAHTPRDGFITGSTDGVLRIWDAQSGAVLRTLTGHNGEITAAVASPDGTQLLSGDSEGELRLWDITSGDLIAVWSDGSGTDGGHNRNVLTVAFNADGTQALSGSVDRQLIVWEVASGQALYSLPHDGRVIAGAFAANDETLYSVTTNDEVTIWDRESGEAQAVIAVGIDGESRSVSAVTFDANVERMLVGRTDGSAVLHDLASRRSLAFYDLNLDSANEDEITTLHFSPDARFALVGTRENRLFTIRTFPLDDLVRWIEENRYVRTLDCVDRATYNVIPLCEDEDRRTAPPNPSSAWGVSPVHRCPHQPCC